jgi:hypothetical protein
VKQCDTCGGGVGAKCPRCRGNLLCTGVDTRMQKNAPTCEAVCLLCGSSFGGFADVVWQPSCSVRGCIRDAGAGGLCSAHRGAAKRAVAG